MSRRDLGSLFDEEGQGVTPAPSDAPRSAPVEESLINDEARAMLEERARAARDAAARATEVAAQKGKEIGKAALAALGRMKEEHQRKALAKVEAKAADKGVPALLEGIEPKEVRAALPNQEEPFCEPEGVLIFNGMGQLSPREPAPIVEFVERPGERSEPARNEAPATKRSYKYVWIAGGVLALAAIGGAAYWWSTRPTSEAVAPPKVAAPVVKPAEPAPAPIPASSVDGPDMTGPVPVVEREPVSAYGGDPVEPAPDVEREPEPVVAPTPKPEPAPAVVAPKPAPKPRPKQVAPAPAAPMQEEQQIEQIRDFGKQLDSLSGR